MIFSIVIPTHNRKEALLICLDQLNKQTEKDFEVIVVDDGSKFPVRSFLDLQSYRFKLRLIRNDRNRGVSHARNRGAREASYPWIVFQDDDDIMMPRKIERIKKTIHENSHVNFIYHRGRVNMVQENIKYLTNNGPMQDPLQELLVKNAIGSPSFTVVRKDFFFKCGGFDEKFKAVEDRELWIKMAKTGELTTYFMDEVLTEYILNTSIYRLSADLDKVKSGYDLIREKYSKDFNALDDDSKKRLRAQRYKHKGFDLLLKGSRKSSGKYMKAFMIRPDIRYLGVSICSAISPKFVFYLRSLKRAF